MISGVPWWRNGEGAVEMVRKLPCWLLIAFAVLVVIFLFNSPSTSSDWAAWVQAIGTVSAVLSGFALNASNKRQETIEQLTFAIDALYLISGSLNHVKSLVETKDASGIPLIAAPQKYDTAELHGLIELIRREAMASLTVDIAVDLTGALRAAQAYADTLDSDPDDVRDSLRRTFAIFEVDKPLDAIRKAIDSLKIKKNSIKSLPILSFK